MPNSLTFFRVDASVFDIEQPVPSAGAIVPATHNVSGYVDFFPGTKTQALASGLVILVADLLHEDASHDDTEVPLAPITGRLIDGTLRTIAVGDPKGVELVANTAPVGMPSSGDGALYYHYRWRNVTYGGALQRLSSGAFLAPTDDTGVVLSSPTLTRYEYNGP